MTTHATGSFPMLVDLPDELLIEIFELLPNQRDLANMCRVSKRMSSIADPVLHKSLLFDKPKHQIQFSNSLATRPRRGSMIQSVKIDYPSSALDDFVGLINSPIGVDGFSHTLAAMSNLETLVVSVPVELCRGMGHLFNHPFALACLKTCSLFYQTEDDQYWDLQDNIHIFSHPDLENLTIRRARLDETGFDSLEKPTETALKVLHLIECDINDDALCDILLHPESLKEFTMTHVENPNPPLEESSEDVEDYIFALKSAQHSLETISIDVPTLGGENALRLRDFQVLNSIRLREHQLFGTGSPRLHSVGLPLTLSVMDFLGTVGNDEDILDLLCYTIENKEIMARNWVEMGVVGGEEALPDSVVEACKSSGLKIRRI